MDKKANVVVILIILILSIGLVAYSIVSAPKKFIQRDTTEDIITESDIALRKAVINGISRSMDNGLSLNDNAWFCNRPLPPDYKEANYSLKQNTNELLEKYLERLRKEGYYEKSENISYGIEFTETDSFYVTLPGYSVLITDISGSMLCKLVGKCDKPYTPGSAGDQGFMRLCDDPKLYNPDTMKFSLAMCYNKIAISTILDKTPRAKLGLVSYRDSGKIVSQLTNDKNKLIEKIDQFPSPMLTQQQINAGVGATCVSCGIYHAAKLLMNVEKNRPKTMLVMSDGVANRCEKSVCVKDVFPEAEAKACDSEDKAKAEALKFAQWAHDLYGINIYSVSFGSSEYTDDATMEAIACADNCSHFKRSENAEELAKIYEEIALAMARVVQENYTYLTLENDRIRAITEELQAGLDKPEIKTKRTVSGKYLYNLTTWYLYKHVINWLVFEGYKIIDNSNIIHGLTGTNCQAVYYKNGQCGTLIPEEVRKSLHAKEEDFNPSQILNDIEINLNNFLNQSNLTSFKCSGQFSKFEVDNIEQFDYRAAPRYLPVNKVFGNGTIKITGDGTKSTADCPQIGIPPDGRDDFLNINYGYETGKVGFNGNSCSSSNAYEYFGLDKIVRFDIEMTCADKNTFLIDGTYNFEPLQMKFIIRVDMMNDCDPPEDKPKVIEGCQD